ncbi:MAG: FIST signal transduction protein [Bacillota bacterium]
MFGQVASFHPGDMTDWRRFLTSLHSDDLCGIFLMVGEKAAFVFDEVSPLFKEMGVPVFGGVFPGVVYGDSWYREGVLGCGIVRPVSMKVVKNLGGFEGLLEDRMAAGSDSTFLVLVDGLAQNIASFLDVVFETCSGPVSFIGGGAGSLGPERRPVLFTGEECFASGALLIGIEGPMGVGVSHGWEPVYGPLVANRTDGNVMIELNWQPAFLNYRQTLEERDGISIDAENFFEIAKRYPFGMVKIDGSIVVRDPIRFEDESRIVLVGEIPENSVVMVLRGDSKKLVDSGREAAIKALDRFKEQTAGPRRGALVIDCISRVLFLGDDIAREFNAIRSSLPPGMKMFGFLSIGEIASPGDKYLEFYNKTTVVGVG